MNRFINKIIIHHSITPRDLAADKSIRSIDRNHGLRLHKTRNGLGLHVAYHFVISGDGVVHETRPVNEIGYHASNWYANLTSIGICLLGDFDNEDPSIAQWNALDNLVAKLRKKHNVPAANVKGHRAYSSKSCPGRNISEKEIGEIALGIREVVPADDTPSDWAASVWNKAIEEKIVTKDPKGELLLRDAEIILHRLGGISQLEGKLSRERFLVALSRLGVTIKNINS